MTAFLRTMLTAALVGATLFGAPAATADSVKADCEFDGSVPGSEARVYTVATPGGGTFYIDDRDHLDLDDDGVAGGIWIYMESNRVAGLQRGKKHVVFEEVADPEVPVITHLDPMAVGPVTVFPNGYTVGGWAVSEYVDYVDGCGSEGGDRLLF